MGTLTDDLLSLVTTLAYPVDVEDPLSDMEPEVSYLSDLAAVEVVSNVERLKAVHQQRLLPLPLYPTLLRASLLWGHDKSLKYLVENWPYPYIRLRDVLKLPLMRSPLAIVYYEMALAKLKIGIRLTTAVIRTLLDCLSELNSKTTRLQFIDLSGFPTAEVVACYAAVQCQLVNTDVQRQQMVKNFNELLSLMSTEDKRAKFEDEGVDVASFKPYEESDVKFGHACSLFFDLTLSNQSRVDEVMNSLVWSKSPSCRFRLVMSALNLQGLGYDIVTRIVEYANKAQLRSLDLAHNSMGPRLLVLASSWDSEFNNLTSLDLSCNSCNMSSINNVENAGGILGESLSKLPALKHLSLSKNRLSRSLEAVLSKLPNTLETLRLAGCSLHEPDLKYLASTNHGLRYLDLSENTLGDPDIWSHLVHLLKLRGSWLYSLDLGRTFIGDDELVSIVKQGGEKLWLRNLRYWNLSRNIIVTRFLRVLIEYFEYDAPRCVLHLPCPFSCREREDGEGNPDDGSNIRHDLAAHGDLKMLARPNMRIVFSGQPF